ncbi:stage II sporulation protein D [Gottschalkia purinilytica]|uniref:Stage II sporulation protein D n=1 Tax=Gottschalkia purinilytica TaxID=1503 RepID=A0A0L0WE88_GOTPU|nr:stage II sporulation protein D [Gottschalkia purinilytica]KNF09793.1 stage II sporulation protein D [Gottschalkia purinilytica]
MSETNQIYIDIFAIKEEKVVRMSLEDAVIMVVASQVNIDFELEAIKAQAIIARTQIVKSMKRYGGRGCSKNSNCDICDDGHCINIENKDNLKMMWKKEYEKNMEKITKAVKETEDLIMTINGRPITPRFHDTCGGSTENAENVISNKVIYLRRVLCDKCEESPNWEKNKEIRIEDLEAKLDVKFPKPSPFVKSDIKGFIENIERDEHGRIISVEIAGKKFKGTDIMDLLDLDSTRISFLPNVITFNTIGKGDGLGLCQFGSNKMAKEGYSSEEILKYYFTGVEIKKLEKPCIEKPLNGKIIVIDPGHGGENSGDYTGINGLRERDIVLKISKKLKKSLEKLGAVVELTRTHDEYISLKKRVEFANKIRPSFFMSIHMNAYSNPSIHGCEIYHFRSDIDGENLAKSIMSSLSQNTGILDRGIRIADLYLLREVYVSSIQIELEYITNPEKEIKFRDNKYIDSIVRAITNGILNYCK